MKNILKIQCLMLQADSGAVLRMREDNKVEALTIYPQIKKNSPPPSWMTKSVASVPKALSSDNVMVIPLTDSEAASDQSTEGHVLMAQLHIMGVHQTVIAFCINNVGKKVIDKKIQTLQLTTSLINSTESRLLHQANVGGLSRLQQAMEVLSSMNRQDHFKSSLMALCNEIAAQWQCERVSIGFLQRQYIHVRAMSYTEDFSRKMKAVHDIESTMEECLDQDMEILHPLPEGTISINRSAENLARLYGPSTVLSLPLRRENEVFAVLTLERPLENTFSQDEIETIRLTCELTTARLSDLYQHGRWIGSTLAIKTKKFLAKLLGPEYTLTKLTVLLVFFALSFLIFAKGLFRVKSPFILEATHQQVIPAPFDGYIKSVDIEINHLVEQNKTTLATLDSAELLLQLAEAKAEKAGYLTQTAAAMRDRETAQAQVANANADKVSARIDLLNYKINQASLLSPITGIVIKGDLKQKIGAPVKTGDVLFEVSPLKSLRAELLVPEYEIYDIQTGQEGYLATASYPGQKIKFIVERINPMAEVVNQRNIFKVRVHLTKTYPWMRPGMEGVAKISVGKRHYAWIWTRKIVNWIRMKLWI